MVVRSALCGLQSSADRGECSHTGHDEGSVDWQLAQMACSQQGRRKASTASLLQMAQRSLAGISSWDSELECGGIVLARIKEATRVFGTERRMMVALPDQLGLRFRRHIRRSYLCGEDTLDKGRELVDELRRNHRECRVWGFVRGGGERSREIYKGGAKKKSYK